VFLFGPRALVRKLKRIERENPSPYTAALTLSPTARRGKPEKMARATVFLASPAASFISGTKLLVDSALTRHVQIYPEQAVPQVNSDGAASQERDEPISIKLIGCVGSPRNLSTWTRDGLRVECVHSSIRDPAGRIACRNSLVSDLPVDRDNIAVLFGVGWRTA
jgi:hypothetical protein